MMAIGCRSDRHLRLTAKTSMTDPERMGPFSDCHLVLHDGIRSDDGVFLKRCTRANAPEVAAFSPLPQIYGPSWKNTLRKSLLSIGRLRRPVLKRSTYFFSRSDACAAQDEDAGISHNAIGVVE